MSGRQVCDRSSIMSSNELEVLGVQVESGKDERVPLTEGEKLAIRSQLDRILLDSQFRNSRRYPSFLRYVVDHTLDGDAGSLKERVIGVEVFGRAADYDSTQDPIVRVTAAEIRKRIARYYLDPRHEGEMRLSIPAGSYVPVFAPMELDDHAPRAHRNSSETHPAQAYAVEIQSPVEIHSALETPLHRGETPESRDRKTPRNEHAFLRIVRKPSFLWSSAIAIVVVTAVCVGLWRAHQPSMMDVFWAPFRDSSKSLLFCIADQSGYHDPSSPLSQPVYGSASPEAAPTLVAAEDAVPLVDFVSQIRAKGQPFHVQVQSQTNFNDFSQVPATLIGALDNKWTLFFTSGLRFHFASDEGLQHIWIADREHPERRDWMSRSGANNQNQRTDYAIIARFINAQTQQPTVVIAGLGHDGTAAAGNFVTSEDALALLEKQNPSVRSSNNLEIVIETLVLNGHPGSPHILAIATW